MQGHFQPGRAADASCLASARSWRKEAEHLRDNADAATLTNGQRAALLREAEAAERQADWWLDAIERHRRDTRDGCARCSLLAAMTGRATCRKGDRAL